MCKKLDELRSLYVLGDYEKTSANLMKKVEWNDIPVKIEVILDRLGIPFNEKEFTQSEAELKQNNIKVGVQGMVHVEKDNIEIFYNSTYQGKRATKHKISFTLAHELSHSILHANEIDANKGFLDFYRLDDEDEYIDDDKEVNFQGTTVSVDVLEEKDKVTNELEDESEGLESALNFIKSNFIKSVEAATKSKTKEVTYKKYVTDSIIKSWKTAVYYISCEFTYNGTKVTARRTGNYVKPQGVVLNALYCTVDKESAVQKPSSKRRIAYVSGTLEGGIQIKGTGLIVDRFWGRAEIECNSKGTISKRFRHS